MAMQAYLCHRYIFLGSATLLELHKLLDVLLEKYLRQNVHFEAKNNAVPFIRI